MASNGAAPRGNSAEAVAAPAQSTAPGAQGVTDPRSSTAHEHDIVTTAEASLRLTTFIDCLRSAGLTELLRSVGPFTVFAPTNRAFAKLSQRELDALLADRGRLIEVLRHHIVAGLVAAPKPDVAGLATPIDGLTLTLTSHAGIYRVDSARLVQTDIPAANGVIHAIDTVLISA